MKYFVASRILLLSMVQTGIMLLVLHSHWPKDHLLSRVVLKAWDFCFVWALDQDNLNSEKEVIYDIDGLYLYSNFKLYHNLNGMNSVFILT